jgi:hypothetical protein
VAVAVEVVGPKDRELFVTGPKNTMATIVDINA